MAEIRAEIEQEILQEIAAKGPTFDRKPVLDRLLAAGYEVSKTTFYRWADSLLKSGRANAYLGIVAEEAVRDRQARGEDPAVAAAQEAVATLPAVITPDDVANSTVPFIQQLKACIEAAQQVMTYARRDDGAVRVPKLLIGASEHLRRCLETLLRFQEAMSSTQQIERFHAAVLEEVQSESPECAERILRRLQLLSDRVSGQGI